MAEECRRRGDVWLRIHRLVAEREAQLRAEREAAPSLFRSLQGRNRLQRRLLVQNSPRFVTWGFCEFVLAKAWEQRLDDASATIEWASLGLTVAERLDPALSSLPLVNDLRARACAYLGQGLTGMADIQGAELALAQATDFLREGTGDPLEEASFLRVRAELCGARNHLREAIFFLKMARRKYVLAGDRHRLGICLAEHGLILARSGRLPAAVSAVDRGRDLMHPEIDPQQYLATSHHLICLHELNGSPQANGQASVNISPSRPRLIKGEWRNVPAGSPGVTSAAAPRASVPAPSH